MLQLLEDRGVFCGWWEVEWDVVEIEVCSVCGPHGMSIWDTHCDSSCRCDLVVALCRVADAVARTSGIEDG